MRKLVRECEFQNGFWVVKCKNPLMPRGTRCKSPSICPLREPVRKCVLALTLFEGNLYRVDLSHVVACGFSDGCKCEKKDIECSPELTKQWAEDYKKKKAEVVGYGFS
jgi:hypothetical protein